MSFKLHSPYLPAGDQPEAIRQLTEGIEEGERYHTLLGVTGSGKTFTIANVIQNVQRPTLVLTHNKTLVAQLYGELQHFFENAVGYFVSYYDYYQPEAYMPVSNTYIEKSFHQRRVGQAPVAGDHAAVERAKGYHRCRFSQLYLWYRQPGGVRERHHPARAWPDDLQAGFSAFAGQFPV